MDKPQRLARSAEQETARLHGGRVTPMSGSGDTVKNDVRNPQWSIEVKTTSHKTYPLSRAVLATAASNALADGRRMALVVEFFNPPGTYHRGLHTGRYVVMSEDDHLEREEELRRLRNFRYYGNEEL